MRDNRGPVAEPSGLNSDAAPLQIAGDGPMTNGMAEDDPRDSSAWNPGSNR